MIRDEDIYYYLLGEYKVGENRRAPQELRSGDRVPSFGIYIKNNKLLWHDFGLPRKPIGNTAIDLLMEMRKVNRKEAMRIIETEIQPRTISYRFEPTKTTHYTELPSLKYREPKDFELEYWKKFGVSRYDLIYERIYALDVLKYAGSHNPIRSTIKDPAFVYLFGENQYKLYRPLTPDTKNKFRMFNCSDVIEGEQSMMREQENVGKLKRLFILSSTKDRVVWKKTLSLDESAINPISEKILRKIVSQKERWYNLTDEIIVIFDADETGLNMSKELAEALGGKYIDLTGILPKTVKDLARAKELGYNLKEIYEKC